MELDTKAVGTVEECQRSWDIEHVSVVAQFQ